MKGRKHIFFAVLSLCIVASILCAAFMTGGVEKNDDNPTSVQSVEGAVNINKAYEQAVDTVGSEVKNKAAAAVSGAEVLDKGRNEDGSSKSIVSYTKDDNSIQYDEEDDLYYVNNIVIIFFESGTTNQRRLEIIETVGGRCVGYMDAVDQWQVEVEATDLEGIKSVCEKLLEFDEVIYANFDGAMQISECAIPDDPFGTNNSWNESVPAGNNWGQEAIQLPSAWEYDERFDIVFNHVTVGLVDNGFATTHADLSGIIAFPSTEAQSRNAANSHGSHVAGIIGAHANNATGIAGVLWDTTVLGYDYDGNNIHDITDSDIYAGLVDCVEGGAKVVNFSIGASTSLADGESLSEEQIIYEAEIASQYMAQLLNAGYDFVVVQAAGNGTKTNISTDAVNNGMFCCITADNTGQSPEMAQMINDRIIIVGSAAYANYVYTQSYFSNVGSQVDLCAPGNSIYSCTTNNSYVTMSGTSQAAPFVTGVAGLIWSINPALSGAEVRSIICDPDNQPYTVDDSTNIKHPYVFSCGLLNAKCCVEAALDTIPADYSGVEEQLEYAAIFNLSYYTEESVLALTQAINNVDWSLSIREQDLVDLMASNINQAITGLVLKTADYTGVDDAVSDAENIDEFYYTDESVLALNNAVSAVVRDLTILEQSMVGTMESAIRTAIGSLVAKTGILIPEGSTTIINEEHSIIYGLTQGITNEELESDYIKPALGAHLVYTYGRFNQLGTGTKVELVDTANNNVIDTYYIVIVGDINGDGSSNTLDSALANAISAYLYIVEEGSPCFYAADVTGDGSINTLDSAKLNAISAYLTTADQTMPSSSILAG